MSDSLLNRFSIYNWSLFKEAIKYFIFETICVDDNSWNGYLLYWEHRSSNHPICVINVRNIYENWLRQWHYSPETSIADHLHCNLLCIDRIFEEMHKGRDNLKSKSLLHEKKCKIRKINRSACIYFYLRMHKRMCVCACVGTLLGVPPSLSFEKPAVPTLTRCLYLYELTIAGVDTVTVVVAFVNAQWLCLTPGRNHANTGFVAITLCLWHSSTTKLIAIFQLLHIHNITEILLSKCVSSCAHLFLQLPNFLSYSIKFCFTQTNIETVAAGARFSGKFVDFWNFSFN